MMRSPLPHGLPSGRGFSLIEAMIACAILAAAMLGALSGLMASRVQLHDGATRQYREQLLDASAQRWMLGSKTTLGSLAGVAQTFTAACPSTQCNLMPISGVGTTPWVPDPTQAQVPAAPAPGDPAINDLSIGAYFTILTDGTLTHLTGAYADCNATPPGSYCREMLVTTGMKTPIVSAGVDWTNWTTTTATTPFILQGLNANVTTLWIRVSKHGDSPSQAVYFSTSFVQ